jgi:Tfp pilus assembly protein PilF
VDWRDEESIFLSGLKVNSRNAKLYNNVGHALESQKKHDQALVLFKEAAKVQPDDIGAHINIGRAFNSLAR